MACTLGACFWDFDASRLPDGGGTGGCVDDLGVHHPGTEPTACGGGGALCAVCTGSLDACLDGLCVPEHAPIAIAAGGSLSCALDREGAVWCWGTGRSSLLGLEGESAEPVRIDTPEAARAVAAGGAFSTAACMIGESGRLYCWGDNTEGQTGIGEASGAVYPPREVASGGTAWTDVAIGHFHALGIEGGRLHGWGDGFGGENALPPGTTVHEPTPVGELATWIRVSTNENHGCAIRDAEGGAGSLYCWGSNARGQLGTGEATKTLPPGPVPTASPTGFTGVSAGLAHTCGIRTPGRLFCWGLNDEGQLGTGETTMRVEPTEVTSSAGPFTEVTTGDAHTCALDDAGGVWCFGSNGQGQLGLPDDSVVGTDPTPVLTAHEVIDLAAGTEHTCAITRERRIFCWGSNSESQSGDGTNRTGFHPVPQEVVLQ
jgi:alpha-tubulin suppressor-like RCC1 family protein